MLKPFNQLDSRQQQVAIKYALNKFEELFKDGEISVLDTHLANLEDLAMVAAEYSLYKISSEGNICEVVT